MNRHPWRTRVWLAGLFDVVAGGVVGVLVYLGVTEGISLVEAGIGVTQSVLAIAVSLGVISDGERKTTPVDDPIGNDGLPLVNWQDAAPAADPGH